jgi:protein TonB
MLRTLLESNAPRQRRRAGALASIAVHTGIIAGAVVATASTKSAPQAPEMPPEWPPVYVTHVNAKPVSGEGAPTRRATDEPKLPAPRPHELVPNYVKDLATNQLADIDPRTLLSNERLVPIGPPGRIGGDPFSRTGSDEPATAASVDRVAALLAPPQARYPDQLRAAGVTGRVVVRLIVDTTGRVEPASVIIRESSHDLFAQAVRAVLPTLRFVPADVGGRKVRMLVDLPFEFRLTDRDRDGDDT